LESSERSSFSLHPFDIAHPTHIAVVEPETAFWGLVQKDRLAESLAGGPLHETLRAQGAAFAREMDLLRFHLKPSAVYFNPTERCNLNCSYCYIPGDMRRRGKQMETSEVLAALERLHLYFRGHMPEDRLPQVIFHGAEPLLAREAIFAGIEAYDDRFRFGVQTNATLLDEEAVSFLTSRGVGVGLSLDGPVAEIADRTRRKWRGVGVFDHVVRAIDDGYPGYNVILHHDNRKSAASDRDGGVSPWTESARLHAQRHPLHAAGRPRGARRRRRCGDSLYRRAGTNA
jgi:uncharacterized protein